VIDQFFAPIKRFRRIATRYERKAENFVGFAWFTCVLLNVK
jgi:transposase